jgi:hypothetical protein
MISCPLVAELHQTFPSEFKLTDPAIQLLIVGLQLQ